MTTTLLALSDIARLAKVQRPVVTVWRSRDQNGPHPFPSPVEQRNAQDFFAVEDIVAWLKATNRGNNPEIEADAAAFTLGTRVDALGLSALLVLRTYADQPLAEIDPEELLDLADEVDPDNEFCFQEIEALGDRLEELAAFTDQLVDAAYGVGPAIEQLFADRFRAAATELSSTLVTESAQRLVATVALELDHGARVFREATAGGSDLLVALAELLGETADASLGLLAAESTTPQLQRLALRRLHVHTALRDNLSLHPSDVTTPGAVFLAQFPGPGQQRLTDLELLRAVDDLILEMRSSDRAVVIGPAALLIDRLNSPTLESERSATLRSGRIRAAVRLPQGLLVSRPRQPLGLWILGPEAKDVALNQREVMVADLSEQQLTQDVIDDLATDLAAALDGHESIRRHAFRFGRRRRTSTLLAAANGLVPPSTSRTRSVRALPQSAAESLVLLENALTAVNETSSIPRPLALNVGIHTQEVPNNPSTWTIQNLLDAGLVKILPGARIADTDLLGSAASGLDLWTADLLVTSSAAAKISPLVLAQNYPFAKLTEPGDIVFHAGPIPRAVVDPLGAGVVRFPLRILRVTANEKHGLIPDVLARDMATATYSDWRSWEVRAVPKTQVEKLTQVLAELAAERNRAQERVARLEEVESRLIAGLAEGKLEMMTYITGTEGRA